MVWPVSNCVHEKTKDFALKLKVDRQKCTHMLCALKTLMLVNSSSAFFCAIQIYKRMSKNGEYAIILKSKDFALSN